jgi:NTF2 fold immunity protein of polymorphic toxin system component
MQIYKIFDEVLVNQDTAIGFARLLLEARFGAGELAHQEPLSITDSGKYWTILGSGKPVFEGAQPGSVANGRAEFEISKYDGRIWKFAVDGHIVQEPRG